MIPKVSFLLRSDFFDTVAQNAWSSLNWMFLEFRDQRCYSILNFLYAFNIFSVKINLIIKIDVQRSLLFLKKKEKSFHEFTPKRLLIMTNLTNKFFKFYSQTPVTPELATWGVLQTSRLRVNISKWWNTNTNYSNINRYKRGLETCPQANLYQSGREYFLLFSDASKRRVWLSAESKILASTLVQIRLYRLNLNKIILNVIK